MWKPIPPVQPMKIDSQQNPRNQYQENHGNKWWVPNLFSWGRKEYLVIVDRYRNFFEIDRLSTPTLELIIECLKTPFACYCIPDTLISDNGSQFSSYAFKHFAKQTLFKHVTSSSWNSQSNSVTKMAVKVVECFMWKCRLRRRPISSAADPMECTNWEAQHQPGTETFWQADMIDIYRHRSKTNSPQPILLLKQPGKSKGGGTIYQPLRSGRIWHKVNF